MRVLLVEDSTGIGESVCTALHQRRFTTDWVKTLEDAQAALEVAEYRLLLLDLGLPDGDGLGLLKQLRARGTTTAILVMTARAALRSRVEGLDSGADDYLVKPFEMDELVSRCGALMRRPADIAHAVQTIGNLRYEHIDGSVWVDQARLQLARREVQLLAALLRRQGRVCRRSALEDELYTLDGAPTPNALEASISRLRTAFERQGCTARVRTVRGVGYVLEDAHDVLSA